MKIKKLKKMIELIEIELKASEQEQKRHKEFIEGILEDIKVQLTKTTIGR